jgi:RNA polymerase sigma factor (TIGR02999 family)
VLDDRERRISELLAEGGGGASSGPELAQLVEGLYDELHGLARRFFRNERRGHTLQPTALVNEAYLRLAKGKEGGWKSRAHFLAWAARIMREVLLNHARDRRRLKRGGGAARVPMEDLVLSFEECAGDLEAVNEALEELARLDERKARIVELRFFGGLTTEEVGEVVGVARSTVEREWRFARAWLLKRLKE